jgi:hypothetical protein
VLKGRHEAARRDAAAGRARVRPFHATGDCGSTRGPKTQNEVTDKMIGDFNEAGAAEIPPFALLLGDIVYNFGETEYYYDQFYEPYRTTRHPSSRPRAITTA